MTLLSFARSHRFISVIPVIAMVVAGFWIPHGSFFVRSCLAALFGAVALVVFPVFDRWLEKRCDEGQRRRLSISALLGSVLFLVPFALRAQKGSLENTVFDLFCYAGCVCFCSIAIAARVEPLSGPMVRIRRNVFVLFPISIGIYGLVLGWQIIALYNAYGIEWADFAFEYPPLWQSLRAWPFRMIDILSWETNYLQFHWPLIYLFLAPVTIVGSDPRVSLLMYTLFFMATGWSVYILACHYTTSRNVAGVIAAAFMAYLPVHCAHLSGLHADPLAMPFIIMSFYFAAIKAWKRYWVMVGLALMCKEYVGLVYAGYGVYLAFRNLKTGILTAVAGFAWFLFVITVGIPFFNHGEHPWVMDMNYGTLGGNEGMLSMVLFSISHPGQFAAVLFRPNNSVAMVSLLLPFSFLPVMRPWVLAAGVLIVLKNALSASGIELLVHREALFVPFIIYAVILFIGAIPPGAARRFYCGAIMVSVLLTFLAQGHAFPARGFWLERERYRVTAHERTLDALVKKIPPGAPVMASSHITPRLMTRKWYFLFPHFPAQVEPEYCIVDTAKQQEYDWYPLQAQRDSLRKIIDERRYVIMERKQGIFLLRRASAGEP